MIQALFFDFNGVVIDDEPLQLKAYQQILAEQEIGLSEEQYYASMGMDDRAFLRTAFARSERELTPATMQQLLRQKSDIHRRLILAELPIFPGVATFLKTSARRYPLALVSMAQREEIEYVLTRAHLSSLFSVVISGEDVARCKPDPECFALALAQMNVERRPPLLPQECLVIEDAAQGIAAGRAAGMRTLGVTNSVTEAALRAAGAEVVTKSLADWTLAAVERVWEG